MIYLAVDLGSYLCRFIAAKKKTNYDFELIDSANYIINFGQVKPGHKINMYVLDKVIRAFESFKHYLVKENKVLCVATAGVRFSDNSIEFIEKLNDLYGIDLKILSPEEEIYYSSLACIDLIHTNSIVIDVGSGSTEIGLVEKKGKLIKIIKMANLELGLVNNLESKNIRNTEFNKMEFLKKLQLPVVFAKCGILKTVYNYCYNANQNDTHGKKIYTKDLENMVQHFMGCKNELFRHYPFIGPKKIRLIKVGLPWILRLLKELNCSEFVISEFGLKEGLIMSMINEKTR